MLVSIMVGMPGCGKSTFAKGYKEGIEDFYDKKACFLDLNDIYDSCDTCTSDYLMFNLDKFKSVDVLIVDGLFLQNRDLVKIINLIKSLLDNKDLNFEIHYWGLDREACVKKVKGDARKIYIIENSKQDILDINYIKEHTGITGLFIASHKVMNSN